LLKGLTMNDPSFSNLIESAAHIVVEGARPMLFLGRAVPECAEVDRIVEVLRCPVVISPGAEHGFRSLGTSVLGRYSFGRRRGIEQVVARADVVACLYADGSEFLTRGGLDLQNQTVVHIFDDPRDFLRGFMPLLSIKARPDVALSALADALERQPMPPRSPWFEAFVPSPAPSPLPQSTVPDRIHPEAAARIVQQELPESVLVALDIGGFTAFVLQSLEPGPSQSLFCPIEREGCMGEAMLAAPGFSAAKPERRVLVIVGDGGLSMVPSELRCAVEEGARITFLVWSNNGFKAVADGLRRAFGPECALPSGTWIGQEPDLAKVAEGWGTKTYVANGPDSLRQALRASFAVAGPAVVVALVDASIECPMGDRFTQFKPGCAPQCNAPERT
jgi:thiamine pyrophosphate-dependent acetolactate synthase large subunit-like protein